MEIVGLLTLWVALFSTGAILVRVGQTLIAVGAVRSKNAASAVSRSLCDLFIVVLGVAFIGFRVFGGGIFAWPGSADPVFPVAASALAMQFTVMVLIATGVAVPAVSERSRFYVPVTLGALLAVLVVPLAGRWVWHGWLAAWGFIDVAGAAPIHLAGAACAAAAAVCVGPRSGKYNRDGSISMIPGHHTPFTALGTLLVVAGWLPYVMGASLLHASTGGIAQASQAGMNVLVAAAAGGLAAACVAHVRNRRNDVPLMCAGTICGAVAMTASGGTIGAPAAASLGLLAGLLQWRVSLWLDLKLKVDDPGASIATHASGAVIGSLGAAIFSAGTIAERFRQLGIQAAGVIVVGVLAFGSALALFAALRAAVGLRVREGDEYDGLDLAEHDLNAYPDFQQTMI